MRADRYMITDATRRSACSYPTSAAVADADDYDFGYAESSAEGQCRQQQRGVVSEHIFGVVLHERHDLAPV